MTGTAIQTVVKPLERLAVSAPYAFGVYLAVSSGDPVYVGALFAFLMLSQRVAGPLMQMAQLINQYDEARTAVTIVGRLVNQPAEEGRSGHGVRAPLKGLVEFSGVTFKYKGAVSPALNNISFEIPLGTTLGVMGKSGSGKTTITRLLQRLHLRLWRSDQGRRHRCPRIRRRPSPAQCRRGAAGELPVQRHDPREYLGRKPDATFDDIVRAARLAGAEEFIDKLPRGYETYRLRGIHQSLRWPAPASRASRAR